MFYSNLYNLLRFSFIGFHVFVSLTSYAVLVAFFTHIIFLQP